MEQIRQILSQLALHLELNIAMCDKIQSLEERLIDVEARSKANTTRIDAARVSISELTYKFSGDSYEARRAARNALKD